VNQREVGADTLSFHAALKHILRRTRRHLIGEIRDMETLDVALKAATRATCVRDAAHDRRDADINASSASIRHQHEKSATDGDALQAVSRCARAQVRRPGRVAACEVLINTAAVRDNIRDVNSQLNIPDLIKEGTVQ